jgi:hypothetical protein
MQGRLPRRGGLSAAVSGSSSMARSHQTSVIWHMLALECLLPVTKCSLDNLITIAVQGDSVSIPFDFFCEDGAPFANVTPRIAIPSRGGSVQESSKKCRHIPRATSLYRKIPLCSSTDIHFAGPATLILSTTAYGALVFKVERERLFQIQIDLKLCDPRTRGSDTTHKIISNKMLLTFSLLL